MNPRLPWGSGLWRTDRFIPGEEPAREALRPSAWFILLHAPRTLLALLLIGGLSAAWAIRGPGSPHAGVIGARIAGASIALLLAIGLVRWLSRLYVLTDRRVVVVAGVLSQSAADVPRQRIQHVTLHRSLIERLLGLGTIGICTAGTDGPAVRMLMVARPARVVESIRSPRAPSHQGIPVLGLAGGIGSGKSQVARLLTTLGCVAIDSDAEARAALDRPEVRRKLVEWWGDRVLTPEGQVDRSKVASIIFSDPTERSRLEHLVHPIVRETRAGAIARARAAGAIAAVIDAPLLFEAGVDSECDAVIWVEASRPTRLQRVRLHRAWDEAELDRREQAQWPVERKRALCRYEILNDVDADAELADRVGATLKQALADIAGVPRTAGGA